LSFAVHVDEKSGRPSRLSDQEELSMKHWFLGLAVMTILVLALTLPMGTPAAPPAHNAVPAANAASAHSNATPVPEPHPEIRAAMDSLHHAKDHLEHAAHDFGGHRADAIRAIDEAERQLQICLRYDR
jgi:hypothetical protein